MNGSIKVNYDNMDSFKEFLTEDLIAETKRRRDLIYSNMQESNKATDNIKVNCRKLSIVLNLLEEEFVKSTTHFDKVAKASNLCAGNLCQASTVLKEVTKNMKENYL